MKRLLAAGCGRHLPGVPRVPRRRARPAAQSRIHHARVVPARVFARGPDVRGRGAGARVVRRRRALPVEFVSYRDGVRRHAGFDPFDADAARAASRGAGAGPRRSARGERRARRAARSHRRRAGRTRARRACPDLPASLPGLAGGAGAARSRGSAGRACASSCIIAASSSPTATMSSRAAPSSGGASPRISSSARRARPARAPRSIANLLAALDAGLPDCAGRRARVRSRLDARDGRGQYRRSPGFSRGARLNELRRPDLRFHQQRRRLERAGARPRGPAARASATSSPTPPIPRP